MDEKLATFVGYVRDHAPVTPSELAIRFKISTRSVYNYISRSNDQMGPIAQIEREGTGYILKVDDDCALFGLLQGNARRSKAVPTSSEERVSYLLNDLLMRTDWITLDALSAMLFVSRGSVSADLKRVETVLGEYGLSLERRPRYGIRINGPEVNRRICIAKLAIDTSMIESLVGVDHAAVEEISCIVDAVLAEEGLEMSFVNEQNLLVHLVIALARIREDCYMPMDIASIEGIEASHEYCVAHRIAEALEEHFDVCLPRQEVAYIAIHLAGKQAIEELPEDADASLIITDEVWNVVARMLDRVFGAFRFDFRDDLELRMNLARHVGPLSVRLKYRMQVKNPLLSDTRSRFPLAYSMATEAASVLAEAYRAEPTEDEIGFIALAFALAMERRSSDAPKKSIVVACASGMGSARLLEHRYRQQFGDRLDRVVVCDAGRIDSIDLTGIDYVFTTVPLPHTLSVPVREVHFFLDDEDVLAMNRLLVDPAVELGCYDHALFFSHRRFLGRDEALTFLCRAIREREPLPENFFELVLEREALAPTSFGNQVAIPHPMESVAKRTFVAVCLLDESIDWAGKPVRAIFLLGIARERDVDLDNLYHGLFRVLMDGPAMDRLLEDQRLETLVNLIRRLSETTE